MYYPDLSPCDYFGQWQHVLVAVGWLEPGHESSTGPVSKSFFEALVRLLADPWQPAALAGHRSCGFCHFTGGPAVIEFEGHAVRLGTENLFVPAPNRVYVAPSMIAHYVDAHDYCPPSVFQEAVLKCPRMKSSAYLKQIAARRLALPRRTD